MAISNVSILNICLVIEASKLQHVSIDEGSSKVNTLRIVEVPDPNQEPAEFDSMQI